MKMISIRQPWASLIVSGAKDVENRTWPTRYRGTVLIHASLRADHVTGDDIARRFGVPPPSVLPVCTENLNPGVVMMKSAEYRVRTDDSSALNRARDRRIFIQ